MTKKSISILISGFIAMLAIPGCVLYEPISCAMGYYTNAADEPAYYMHAMCGEVKPGFTQCMEEHGYKAHRYSSFGYFACPNICTYQKDLGRPYFAPKGMCD